MASTEATRARPLSPHLSIYRPTMTMAMSIMHRITGGALYFGVLLLAWFLLAASMDAAAFGVASGFLNSIIGRLILFGFTWALAFHFLNGIRHLAWDLGYGFEKRTATQTGSLVYVLSVVLAVAIFAFAWAGYGGYLQ